MEGAPGTAVGRRTRQQRHTLTEGAHEVVNGEGAQIGAEEPTQLSGVHSQGDHTEDHEGDEGEEIAG